MCGISDQQIRGSVSHIGRVFWLFVRHQALFALRVPRSGRGPSPGAATRVSPLGTARAPVSKQTRARDHGQR
jgi:hypothetical protein